MEPEGEDQVLADFRGRLIKLAQAERHQGEVAEVRDLPVLLSLHGDHRSLEQGARPHVVTLMQRQMSEAGGGDPGRAVVADLSRRLFGLILLGGARHQRLDVLPYPLHFLLHIAVTHRLVT